MYVAQGSILLVLVPDQLAFHKLKQKEKEEIFFVEDLEQLRKVNSIHRNLKANFHFSPM